MTTEPHLKAELAELRTRLSQLESKLQTASVAPRPSGSLVVLFVEIWDLAAALPVEVVREVVPAAALAALPEAPPWVLGTLNLRGTSLPVVDVAARIGRGSRQLRPSDVIVVVATDRAALGLVVSEVGAISRVELDPSPALDETPHAAYVVGTFAVGASARLLLGVRELLQVVEVPLALNLEPDAQ